jgi:hypothetical protein
MYRNCQWLVFGTAISNVSKMLVFDTRHPDTEFYATLYYIQRAANRCIRVINWKIFDFAMAIVNLGFVRFVGRSGTADFADGDAQAVIRSALWPNLLREPAMAAVPSDHAAERNLPRCRGSAVFTMNSRS